MHLHCLNNFNLKSIVRMMIFFRVRVLTLHRSRKLTRHFLTSGIWTVNTKVYAIYSDRQLEVHSCQSYQ